MAAWSAPPANAQGRRLSLIRDAEIEHIIRSYAEPIFLAAGIRPDAVGIHLVNDPRLNAFVAGGQNMFFNTGLLIQARGPEEVVGVIAHETGHLAGGHLARGQEQIEAARRTALVSALIGVVAAVAAGDAGAGAAVIAGGSTLAERGYLSYTRSMENAADHAGIRYLASAGYSAEGLLNFLEYLGDQELVGQSRQSEYARTHPLTRDRIDFLRTHVATAEATGRPLPDAAVEAFGRMQAKLIGFLQPQAALQRYAADDDSVAARYARSIASYRRGDLASALAGVDRLLAEEPDNPFFHELKGQMLLEDGRPAESRPSYQRAVTLYPGEPTLLVALAQTKLASQDPADLESAIADLKQALDARGGSTPLAWRLLATAYGRNGDLGMAAVALAEEALVQGDKAAARQQAQRALQTLPEGSAGWLRAQDVQRVAEGDG